MSYSQKLAPIVSEPRQKQERIVIIGAGFAGIQVGARLGAGQ